MSKQVPAPAIRVGAHVSVRTPDGYKATGRFVGLTQDSGGPKVRVLHKDGIERHVAAAGLHVSLEA